MPTKKQRRRRAKGLRHEYDFVMVDEEGNVIDLTVPDEPPPAEATDDTTDDTTDDATEQPPDERSEA